MRVQAQHKYCANCFFRRGNRLIFRTANFVSFLTTQLLIHRRGSVSKSFFSCETAIIIYALYIGNGQTSVRSSWKNPKNTHASSTRTCFCWRMHMHANTSAKGVSNSRTLTLHGQCLWSSRLGRSASSPGVSRTIFCVCAQLLRCRKNGAFLLASRMNSLLNCS